MINTLIPKILLGFLALIAIFHSFCLSVIFAVLIWGGHTVARYYYLLPKKCIKGQHVLITGGGMGIGKELAMQLAKFETKITIVELNLEEAQKTLKEMNSKGFKKVQIFQCDVTDYQKVKEVFNESIKKFGDIDILVNNAGIVSGLRLSENNYQLMSKTLQVNTTAHFATILEVFDKMVKRDKGHIVTISSCAGFIPAVGLIDYNASKYGAVGIHESITLELQAINSNVVTTCICPWYVKTNMTVDVDPEVTFGILPLKPSVERIVMAILQEEYEVVLPFKANIIIFLKQFLPYHLYMALDEKNAKKAIARSDQLKKKEQQESQNDKKNI